MKNGSICGESKMMEIAICDDDVITTSYIEQLLEPIAKKKMLKLSVDIFYDGRTLADYINQGKRYDIIYLDIEMHDKNGVDTAREIRLEDKTVKIIYITNHESFAKEVFEVSAYRFITKPIDVSLFERYFLTAVDEIINKPTYFRYQYNKVSYRIAINDIMYFQSDRRVTYIITPNGSQKCYEKLNNVEKKLVDSEIYFYRTHQSFLVNPQYVARYTYDAMELIDGTTLAISENRRKKVSTLFCMIKGEDIIV